MAALALTNDEILDAIEASLRAQGDGLSLEVQIAIAVSGEHAVGELDDILRHHQLARDRGLDGGEVAGTVGGDYVAPRVKRRCRGQPARARPDRRSRR